MKRGHVKWAIVAIALSLVLAAGGCQSPGGAEPADDAAPGALSPVSLEAGEKLRVVATTSLIADVVANVGGDRIELAQLIPTGADPHGFTPAPRDVRTLNDAHVIFINGLGLEESLLPVLENLTAPCRWWRSTTASKSSRSTRANTKMNMPPTLSMIMGTKASIRTHGLACPMCKCGPATLLRPEALDPAQAEAYAASGGELSGNAGRADRELRDQIDAVPDEAARWRPTTRRSAIWRRSTASR